MRRIVTDQQIAEMLADPKPMTRAEYRAFKSRQRAENASMISRLSVTGASGRSYQLTATYPIKNPKGFSVIVGTMWHGKRINLIRCNGQHAPHPNRIEKTEIPRDKFHIHRATERYQQYGEGVKAEAYAEETEEYYDFVGAICFMCDHFGLFRSDGDFPCELPLFRSKS